MQILDYACEYTKRGWPVLPLKPDSKLPATEHGIKDATADDLTIGMWFADPVGGIGVAAGHGFFVVDIDPRNGGDEEWARLCAVHGGAPPTLTQRTGSNGRHLLYRYPDFDVKNGAIADGVDIKSKGGYIVAAPSRHPDTGREYEWENLETPIVSAPQWLLNMLPRKADRVVTGGAAEPGVYDPSDDRPGTVFNQTASWDEILVPHGWSVERTEGDEIFWTRPGKSSGISATTGYDGMDVLYVFTSSTEFEAQTAYSKFSAYAILNHDGDFRAAAKELAAMSGAGTHTAFKTPTGDDSVYTFKPALPPEHFLSRYIDWCAKQTDAALEYHEASALCLLAVASSESRGRLTTYPGGLRTNLYILLTGATTRSRKSTSQKLALSVLRDEYPVAQLPSRATTERLIGMLAEKSHMPTVWAPDEFGIKLAEIYQRDFLKGLEELMLTLYDGEDYVYEKQDATIRIVSPHLNIIAAATPESLAMAGPGAMVGGLLPRFAVVLPPALPPAREVGEFTDLEPERKELVSMLKDVIRWSADHKDVTFSKPALTVLNQAETRLHNGGASVARLATMLYKVSMLVACGRLSSEVSEDDALSSVQIVDRWRSGARRLQPFLRRKSVDLEFEVQVDGALRILKSLGDGEHHRSEVASRLKVQKSKLDAIQGALEDWGLITVTRDQTGVHWATVEGDVE